MQKYRVGFFGPSLDPTRGEGWQGAGWQWWHAAIPSTGFLFPRAIAADQGYWSLRSYKGHSYLGWVKNQAAGGRVYSTVACALINMDISLDGIGSLANKLRTTTASELVHHEFLEVDQLSCFLTSGLPWFLSLHSSGLVKAPCRQRHVLHAADCFDPIPLLAAAIICLCYENTETNIAVFAVPPEKAEYPEFYDSGWGAILSPSGAMPPASVAAILRRLDPYTEFIRRQPVERLSKDVPAVMRLWRDRKSFTDWRERLDIALDDLHPNEMTDEEWLRRLSSFRNDRDYSKLLVDFQRLVHSSHHNRLLDIAAVEATHFSSMKVMRYLAEDRLDLKPTEIESLHLA